MRGERVLLGGCLLAVFAALAIHADQPIVENYVGRQIPTAMVARNLDEGSGFFHPLLDTAPFPNEFLVEPPIYAQIVVGVKHALESIGKELSGGRFDHVWEVSGRFTSAGMITLGSWAFHGLVRRREGEVVALVALVSFGLCPVTLRYGRAFQPDATMLGFVLLGLRGWDAYDLDGRKCWAVLGGLALAVGFALKITVAWVLLPYYCLAGRLPTQVKLMVGAGMLCPALSWYIFAWSELEPSSAAAAGSLASADNAWIWAQTLAPANWLRFATWEAVARNLFMRAFTPVGFLFALAGWVTCRPRVLVDHLWLGWGVGSALAVVSLAAKWHHGYYWLIVAPLAAVGMARLLVAVGQMGRLGRSAAVGLGGLLVVACGYQAGSTWRTPTEWAEVQSVRKELAHFVRNPILIAPEAVLFYAERPGFRLEFSPAAVQRAFGEWGSSIPLDQATTNPLALVDFYQQQLRRGLTIGAHARPGQAAAARSQRLLVIDVGPVDHDSRRTVWRAALRERPGVRIWVDRPHLIMVELAWTPGPSAGLAPSPFEFLHEF